MGKDGQKIDSCFLALAIKCTSRFDALKGYT